MASRCFAIPSLVLLISCVLAERGEYLSTTEYSIGHVGEDKLLVNIVRGRNFSQPLQVAVAEDQLKEKKTDKKARTIVHGTPNSDGRGPGCCGNRYGSGSSSRPDPVYNRIPSDNGRYPPQYNDRPVDRHGWQAQNRPPPSSPSSGRPGSGSYSGSYGGSNSYGGNQAGDRFGSRPSYGSESSSRPGGVGYGSGSTGGYGYGDTSYGYGGGRPSGYGGSIEGSSYGISGTFADGDEFGPGDPGFVENGGHPGNIQTQKAVALKALAGVALIGAAAALASNPVLLPIGIISGRRKRSENTSQDDFQVDYILTMLKNNFAKVYNKRANDRLVLSPKCVARLTCEMQKEYLSDLEESRTNPSDARGLSNLIQTNLLNVESIPVNIKALLGLAISVGSGEESCNLFTCSFFGDG